MNESAKTIEVLNASGAVIDLHFCSEEFARANFLHWRVLEEEQKSELERNRIVVQDVRSLQPLKNVAILPDGMSEVTAQIGTQVVITAHLLRGDALLEINDDFRMPVVSRDGREKVVLATVQGGVITIAIRLDSSGVWQVTQESINADLPEGAHMDFGGFRIFAYE